MDLNKMIMLYYMVGGKISDDPTPPDDTEYTITVDSNVDAIFTSDGLNFVNGVAKTTTAGTYEITAQADGYNTEKKSITVNDMNPNGYWYFDLTEQSTDPADAWMAEYSVKVLVNGEEPTRAYQYYYYSYDSNGNYSDGEAHNNVGEIILKHEIDDFDSNNIPEEVEFYVYINDYFDGSEIFTNEPTLVKIDNGKAYYYLGEMNVEIAEELVEYKIIADANVENAVFRGYNYGYDYEFSFVNKVAQIAKEGDYTVFCSAPGYVGQKAYVELTESEPIKEIYFELEEVNSETGDPSKANKAEYSFEVTINGETAKGNKEVSAYFNNNFENVYSQVDFISSGKIVVKYLDESFNGYPISSFDLDLNINGIPDGYVYESFVIEDPVLTKVETGIAYYSFGVIDVTMEDESTTPNYSIYVYSNPSGASFSSDGLVFDNGLAEVSGAGEYTVNATKPGYYDKNFVVKVTEENPNAVYKVLLDKAPVKYTITATANTSNANFSSYPYLSFDRNGVAEVYETGEYEIECFADGYIEQTEYVEVTDEDPHPSVHFDLERDPDEPPHFDEIHYSVEITIDGKPASGWHSVEWTMVNDYEGKYYSDYTSVNGPIVLEYWDRYARGSAVDSMTLELRIDDVDYGEFELGKPKLKSDDGSIAYYEFDTVNVGEDANPEPEVEYTIAVESNVENTIFESEELDFVDGVATFDTPGTYEVIAKAEGYLESSHTFYIGKNDINSYYYFSLEKNNYTITLSSNKDDAVFKNENGDIIEDVVEYDEPGTKIIYCSAPDNVDQIAVLNLSDDRRHIEYYFDMSDWVGYEFDYSIAVSSNAWGDKEFSSKNTLHPLEFLFYNEVGTAEAEPNVSYSIESRANGYEELVLNNVVVNDDKPHVKIYFDMTLLPQDVEEWFVEDIDYDGGDGIYVRNEIRTEQRLNEWRGGNFEIYENNQLIYRLSNVSQYSGLAFVRVFVINPEDLNVYKDPKYSLKFYKEIGKDVPVEFEIRENAVDENKLSGQRYNWLSKNFMVYGYRDCNEKRYPIINTRSRSGIQANYYKTPNTCYNEEEYPNIKNYINGITVGDYTTEDELERNQVIVRWNSDDPYIYTLSIETSGYYESEYTDEVRGESFYVFTAEEISEAEELVVSIKIRENYVNSYSSEIILKSNGESPEGNYLKLESINNLS